MRQVAYSATMKRRFFLVALCAAGVWSAGAAFAHDRPGRNDDDALERVRRAREQGRILPLETIVAQAERELDANVVDVDRKSTRLNSSHIPLSRMPSSA